THDFIHDTFAHGKDLDTEEAEVEVLIDWCHHLDCVHVGVLEFNVFDDLVVVLHDVLVQITIVDVLVVFVVRSLNGLSIAGVHDEFVDELEWIAVFLVLKSLVEDVFDDTLDTIICLTIPVVTFDEAIPYLQELDEVFESDVVDNHMH
ncbi:hypothetical protein M9Y10_017175, partial [Tritrichomonas musculus]